MKSKILYCDDQQRFIDDFNQRHGDDFEIENLTDIYSVYSLLKSKRKLPDLVIIDLYHPRDIENQEGLADKANKQLAELKLMIKQVKEHVDKAWVPIGINALREIREEFPLHKLPVMINTQRGLFLLEDEKLREIEHLDGEWLIKDRERISATTEAIRIRKFIKKCKKSKRIKRDIFLGIVFTIIGGAIGPIINIIMGSLN